MKFVVSQKDFRKIWKYQFHKNPSTRILVVPCGRRERQARKNDEANNCLLQIFETASNDL
jgi:PIN domain nuclease of toxin-antitoxin system